MKKVQWLINEDYPDVIEKLKNANAELHKMNDKISFYVTDLTTFANIIGESEEHIIKASHKMMSSIFVFDEK